MRWGMPRQGWGILRAPVSPQEGLLFPKVKAEQGGLEGSPEP